jgi:hypothetical protein
MRSNVPAIAIAASLAAYMPWSEVDSVAAADLVAITPVKGCAEWAGDCSPHSCSNRDVGGPQHPA